MKVLALFAHIEDHICFGWPIMQDKTIEKYLVTGTGDVNGALQKSCDDVGIHLLETLGFPDGFFRKTFEVDGIDVVAAAQLIFESLHRNMKLVKPDYIFTHNPWGEYGHFDHRVFFETIYSWGLPMLVTDITADSVCHLNPKWRMYKTLYTEPYSTVTADYDFYNRQAGILKKAGQWTHNEYLDKPHYPPKTTGLYRVFEPIARRVKNRDKNIIKSWKRLGGLGLEHEYYKNINSDSVVFDIGLNEGAWSKTIAEKYNPYIYGFDPIERFCRVAQETLAEYPKAKIFNFGLGGLTRQAIIAVDRGSTTFVEAGNMFHEYQTVDIKSIKEFMSEQKIDFVDLAEINIEGAEYELLNFMCDTGLISKFGTILLQLHEHGDRKTTGQFEEREAIRRRLDLTHKNIYSYDLVWDLWRLRE